MRYHVGRYTDKQSLKSIDQKGALKESGKAVVINTSCTRVKRQTYATQSTNKKNGSSVIPDLWFTSFLRNKISRRETRIEAIGLSPNNSSKLLTASRLRSSFLFVLFDSPLASPSATINSINFTAVEASTYHKQNNINIDKN